jgi:lysophospholipid acyltransferase (LPLAT)-like uncharacterized protein
VPKPFADAAMVIGAPMEVPKGADEATIERTRGALESSLAALEDRARTLVGKKPRAAS